MSNSLAACELLGERRANYSASQQKFQHEHHNQQQQQQQQQLDKHEHHHLIDNDSLSPIGSPLGDTEGQVAMSDYGGGGCGSLQLAVAAQHKRKEKARIAARARRGQEASIIMEIAAELEITQEKLRRIDKATIVRLAIDYMKAFEILCYHQRPASSMARLVLAPSMPARQRLTLSYKTSNNKTTSGDSTIKIARNTTNQTITTRKTTTTSTTLRKQSRQELSDLETNEEITNSTLTTHDEENEHDEDERENQNHQYEDDNQDEEDDQEDEEFTKPPLFSAPKLATTSIFAPKTLDNMNSHFLMIEENDKGKAAFVLRPDTEILDDDDLTHLAPQAGDISISLDADPLDGIPSDDLLMLSPKSSLQTISVFFNCTKAA